MSLLKPWDKLHDRLKASEKDAANWCDYWRGFWDATRPLRHDARPQLGPGKQQECREYLNGLAVGEKAYKSARFAQLTKPKPKKPGQAS